MGGDIADRFVTVEYKTYANRSVKREIRRRCDVTCRVYNDLLEISMTAMAEDGHPRQGIDDDEERHRSLGDDCRQGGAGRSPAEECDEYKIQEDIRHRRDEYGPEWSLAVAKSPEDRAVDVVEREEGDSQEDDPEIVLGVCDDVIRRIHQ